ncbi:DUF4214 domain-containing protein [Dechloromonas sp. ZY10]|uniref:DUF4214 domain-containing protein n=1 Tax=Dechloromonas aquae TaxID=2664436 RepID=UPI00352811A0
MLTEISALTSYPYRTLVYIETRYPDGYISGGTGTVVGRNDVLTATHVVYHPAHGGNASKITVYPGADVNSQTYRFEKQPYGSFSVSNWYAYPTQVYADGDNSLLTSAESQYDIALLTTVKAIGDEVGWIGLSSGYNTPGTALVLGYPEGSSGMMQGRVSYEKDSHYSVYQAHSGTGTDLMGPGSSGGPLYVNDGDNYYLIGVKSSGDPTINIWADIGLVYSQLLTQLSANDSQLPSMTADGSVNRNGTSANDNFNATASKEYFVGGSGLDKIYYSAKAASYSVRYQAGLFSVSENANSSNTDTLSGIERLHFNDLRLALDIDGNAGQAYRLYQAAFNRKPDISGLSYWVDQIDAGITLNTAASAFIGSNEFRSLYGSNPGAGQLVTLLYNNVLHRAPDPGGYDYWLGQFNAGSVSRESLLVNFSESNENKAALIGVIQNGIELL